MVRNKIELQEWFNLPTKTKGIIDLLIEKSRECVGIEQELNNIKKKLTWFRTPQVIKETIDIIRDAKLVSPEVDNLWSKLPDNIEKLEAMVEAFDCTEFTAAPEYNFNIYTKSRTENSFTMGWDSVYRATDYTIQIYKPSTSPMMGGESQTIDIGEDVREYTVDNINGTPLSAGVAYQFTIIASNNSGASNNSRYEGLPVTPRVIEKGVRIPYKGNKGCDGYFDSDLIYVYFMSDYVRTDIRKGHQLFKDAELTIPFTDYTHIIDELDAVLGDGYPSISDVELDSNGVVQYVDSLIYCS